VKSGEFSLNCVKLKYKFNFNKTQRKMENSQSFDFDDFKQKAMKELYAGKPLIGESGIFTPLLKQRELFRF
jgi:hypothetical protein